VGADLEAARRLRKVKPDVTCVLVGPYDTNPSAIKPEELRPYIEDGSIIYVGEQKDVYPYLRDCTAYVLPSYHEGIPKTVLEAMASGRAIITTDAPGCRETVTEGVNGYLVPVKDVDAIVDAMKKMIESPETTAKMAAASRAIAEEKYDVHKVNRKIRITMGIEE
jgi:glycosyltransferase involved in cell wall biosynthesis